MSCTQADFPNMDGVYQLRSKISKSSTSEASKNFLIFNYDLITPVYYIEYSLDVDGVASTSRLERLALDIAFSNKLSHSSMPMIFSSMVAKFSKGPV